MVSTIAEQEGVNHSYVTRVLRLAFLVAANCPGHH